MCHGPELLFPLVASHLGNHWGRTGRSLDTNVSLECQRDGKDGNRGGVDRMEILVGWRGWRSWWGGEDGDLEEVERMKILEGWRGWRSWWDG